MTTKEKNKRPDTTQSDKPITRRLKKKWKKVIQRDGQIAWLFDGYEYKEC